MTNETILKTIAPAKLIISGEHAVVHGHPALAMAINRYTEASVRWSTPFHFNFMLLGINFRQKLTLEALKRLKGKLQKQYQQFESGKINIREVLKHPFELTLYTAINVIDKVKRNLPMGIDIVTDSAIPIGCGLGSSAACVVSVITALAHFLEIHLNIEDYLRLGIESENLQHGFSSGLDVHVSYSGGSTFYQQGQFFPRPLPQFPMYLIQSGQPEASTGECVTHTKTIFKSSQIGNDFATVTRQLDTAIAENNLLNIQEGLRQNHRLLQTVGVVPEKVATFIKAIENRAGAAKICGAGSTRGQSGGVILVSSDEDISDIVQEFNYQIMPIKGEPHGARVL